MVLCALLVRCPVACVCGTVSMMYMSRLIRILYVDHVEAQMQQLGLNQTSTLVLLRRTGNEPINTATQTVEKRFSP
jgi:hypothetical protein